MAIPNKLKQLKEFHGRLFNDDKLTRNYMARMTMKLDPNIWNISITNVNVDGRSQILVYTHQEDGND